MSTIVQQRLSIVLEQFAADDIQAKIVPHDGEDDCAVTVRLAGGAWSPAAEQLVNNGFELPLMPESSMRNTVPVAGQYQTIVYGADAVGLAYGLDRLGSDVLSNSDLATFATPVHEEPALRVRGIARYFTNEVHDKKWFYDTSFWENYLSTLSQSRFNRFSLILGGGYVMPRRVRDSYFLFPYPYLVDHPTMDVHATEVSAEEQKRNLKALAFAAECASRYGIEFGISMWNHAANLMESPDATHVVEGITAQNTGEYCRWAIREVLERCPKITWVSFRLNYESGIDEGSYDFWASVFAGVGDCDRPIELSLRTKGLDQELIGLAKAQSRHVSISVKYCAEHMGLPYHQTSIRELERRDSPYDSAEDEREFAQAGGPPARRAGERRFTRYGYADWLRESRDYDLFFQIWPYTQRLLLWGDPGIAAAVARESAIAGSSGLELIDVMSRLGNKGATNSGGVRVYEDDRFTADLTWNHQKFAYEYAIWGQNLYNPQGNGAPWRRELARFAAHDAAALEEAIAASSRILPLVTTVYLPSPCGRVYWPELYTNMPMGDVNRAHPYYDAPEERVFHNVTPADPELIYGMNEYAADLVAGVRHPKVTPAWFCERLETLAATAEQRLAGIDAEQYQEDPQYLRINVDVRTMSGLGRFFAAKFRAGTNYAAYEATRDLAALARAITWYGKALEHWDEICAATQGVYSADLPFGPQPHERGHWSDRRSEIVADIETLRQMQSDADADADDATDPALAHAPPDLGLEGCLAFLSCTASGVSGTTIRCLVTAEDGTERPLATSATGGDRRTYTIPEHEVLAVGSSDGRAISYRFVAISADGQVRASSAPPHRPHRLFVPNPSIVATWTHHPVSFYTPGKPVDINIEVQTTVPTELNLHYRHMNQAEEYRTTPMRPVDGSSHYHASIPADYVDGEFPILYWFQVTAENAQPALLPGLDESLLNRPYYLIQRRNES